MAFNMQMTCAVIPLKLLMHKTVCSNMRKCLCARNTLYVITAMNTNYITFPMWYLTDYFSPGTFETLEHKNIRDNFSEIELFISSES